MKYSFEQFDHFIDALFGVDGYVHAARVMRYAASLAVLLMLGFCTAHFFVGVPEWKEKNVAADMARIERAVTAVDRDCKIMAMRVGIHLLNPFTQKIVSEHEFSNTTLRYPENWKGPYLRRVPMIQHKPYQLLKTQKGLFIVPGNGVVLPNGMQVGRDIEWKADSDIAALTKLGGALFYRGTPLVRKVVYGPQPRQKNITDPLPAAAKRMNSWLVEFNQAMPFAHHETVTRV